MTKAIFIHTVYFWLKDEISDGERNSFEDGLRKLGTSTNTSGYFWGTPLEIQDRDVVDSSYDYASTSFFDSEEQHEIYQTTDPIHLKFIESHKHIWSNVKVYDHRIKQ